MQFKIYYIIKIPIVFHNASTYDYHLVIKKLAEEFKGEFGCLGENTEKYITFSVSLKKENDNDEIITYKLKFIDSYRFIQSSLSNLADNLSRVYDKKCNKCRERRKLSQIVNLLDLKMVDWIVSVKDIKNHAQKR